MLLLSHAKSVYVWLKTLWADAAYEGQDFARWVKSATGMTIEVVKRTASAKGFVALLRRWVVERTLSWFRRNRRLAMIGSIERDVWRELRDHRRNNPAVRLLASRRGYMLYRLFTGTIASSPGQCG